MTPLTADQLRQIKDYPALIEFLRDELDWPLEAEDIDDLSFDYEPEELGLTGDVAVKINFIKQLRPLKDNQPWGIFYIDFEPKTLPVVVLRRILQKLVIKKRASANDPESRMWRMSDLLFINAFGLEDDRAITFAHFNQPDPDTLPTLKVIGWDGQDTPLHLDRCLGELSHLRFDPDLDGSQWRDQWSRAFRTGLYHSIRTSKLLATTLAQLAQHIRRNACQILSYEKSDGPFHTMMAKFKQALIHDLSEDDFSDMYAQTIAYGLLYTAIRSHVSGEASRLSSEQVQQLVLPTNPFLKEVMEGFFNIGSRKWDANTEKITGIDFDELGINEIITALKDEKTDFDAILRDFGNKNPNEDPVIHFYELFLKEYDALKRKSRGVYYTPQPVVSFIGRSVHEVLKRDFGLAFGLADTSTWGQMIAKNPDITLPDGVSKDDFFVQILDPATGTGTFLVETIDLIYTTMTAEWQQHGLSDRQIQQHWNRYVPDKLLPRLYGFELMMAPYAIAHMKIGVKLYETGYRFADTSKRVQVYLTNTLEEPVDVSSYLATLDPAMAEETREANEIKQKNAVTVVIGNPPYAGHSFNNGAWVANLLRTKLKDGADSYFNVDGADLGERNPKWLNDDYVKFIRYSQYRVAVAGTGVLGFITNHSYIDNPTFRGMRQSLMDTFSKMCLIDLHGNAKKKEKSPDGSKDENVFEIQQGVAINIAAKITDCTPDYAYCHMWGTRKAKFDYSRNNDLLTMKSLLPLKPASSMYLLCPQDATLQSEFDQYVIVNAILPVNSAGVVTARDDLTIQESPNTVWKIIKDFISLQVEAAREKYHASSKKFVGFNRFR
ncbi:MAG: DNA methyltransferase [Phycisphaerae bacterium]|nr:DNA methyltransferase [Phycisphaerae bacterium]